MNNNEWITDRLPTLDEWYVYDSNGGIVPYNIILNGEPWKPIPPCEPYVKPKRWTVEWDGDYNIWILADSVTASKGSLMMLHKNDDECRIIAEGIAEIYNEMMP